MKSKYIAITTAILTKSLIGSLMSSDLQYNDQNIKEIKIMNIQTIKECTEGSFNGSMAFPEVIKKLHQIGIQSYNVDLISMTKTSYDIKNLFHTQNLNQFSYSNISQEFNTQKIKDALLSIQKKETNYPQFLKQIMEAGVCRYEVFIRGFKTIYLGYNGDLYVEPFPSSFLE
jgi:uncharacterized protein YbcV (DUF1398 family)